MIPSGGDEPSKTSQRTSRINFLVVRSSGTVHKFASDSEFSKQKSNVRAEKMAR